MAPILRLNRDVRYKQILDAALKAAKQRGSYQLVRRSDVAEIADVSPALVSYYLGNAEEMQDVIVQYAIHVGDARVLAPALLARHRSARKAPEALKQKAARLIG
jgi:AcrR family transcriptional regulator